LAWVYAYWIVVAVERESRMVVACPYWVEGMRGGKIEVVVVVGTPVLAEVVGVGVAVLTSC
jgi:hypothetical protein